MPVPAAKNPTAADGGKPSRARTPLRDSRIVQHAVANFDALPDASAVRPVVATELLGCSLSTVWRLLKSGKLEKVTITDRVVGIRVGSIRRLLAGQG